MTRALRLWFRDSKSHIGNLRVTLAARSHFGGDSVTTMATDIPITLPLRWFSVSLVTRRNSSGAVTQMSHIHFDDSKSLWWFTLQWLTFTQITNSHDLWLTVNVVTDIYPNDLHSIWWVTFTPMTHILSDDSFFLKTYIHSDDSHSLQWLTFNPVSHIHSNDSHSLWWEFQVTWWLKQSILNLLAQEVWIWTLVL